MAKQTTRQRKNVIEYDLSFATVSRRYFDASRAFCGELDVDHSAVDDWELVAQFESQTAVVSDFEKRINLRHCQFAVLRHDAAGQSLLFAPYRGNVWPTVAYSAL